MKHMHWEKSRLTKRILSCALSLLLAFGGAAALIPAASAAAPEYSESGAVRLSFSDGGIAASGGAGYKIEGTALSVQEAGTYILSGNCADGSVRVKKGVTDVTLVLDGLTLTSAFTAPITCNKSSGVKIVAAAGTVSTLTDSAKNNDDSYPSNADAENAVIKAKDGSNVILCGTGTLNVQANGKNGIKAGASTDTEGEASLVIRDLTLRITADVNDGINAESSLTIESGSITVSAADDAIHSDSTLTVGASGTPGPEITITSCYEGLEAADMSICSGTVRITAEDDCLNAANSDLSRYDFSLSISGGTLWMFTTDGDGIDSNGTISISGGTVEVWTANTADNQPLDADSGISITGGTVFAAGGSAGMGMRVTVSQEYVTFGSGGMGWMGGRPGWDGGWNDSDRTPPEKRDRQGRSGDAAPQSASGGQSGSAVSIGKGSAIRVQDGDGKTLYSTEAPCAASYVIFSSPSLTDAENCSLVSGDQTAAPSQEQESGLPGAPEDGSFVPGWMPGDETSPFPGADGAASDTAERTEANPADSAADSVDSAASASGAESIAPGAALWITLALLGAAALCTASFLLGRKYGR